MTNSNTKLTAVTARKNGRKVQCFLQCEMVNGKAFLSPEQQAGIEKKLGIQMGQSYTIG